MKKNKNDLSMYMDCTVVKANDLIQKSRFSLSLQEQKIILYLIGHINPQDTEFRTCEFSVQEFCRVCGLDKTSGKHYASVKNAIKGIADKSLWIKLENGTETLLRWIEKPYISQDSGTIKIKLDQDMKPFLLQLTKNFTQYELFWTLNFARKYTIRLYELIKSIHYDEMKPYKRVFEWEELRNALDADGYALFKEFKKRALAPAVEEINLYSDKTITCEYIKTGRAVTHISLTVETKKVADRWTMICKIQKDLGITDLAKCLEGETQESHPS